jgi:Xaa-Pro aminopeptidase
MSAKPIATPQIAYAKRRRQLIAHGRRRCHPRAARRARTHPQSRQTHYPYRQDSDLLYLTGFPEPEAVLVLVPGRKHGGP